MPDFTLEKCRLDNCNLQLAVLQACEGNGLLLAAWVTTASMLAQDAALRGAPRSAHDLVATVSRQLGLEGQPDAITINLLVELERLGFLMVLDDEIVIPILALAEASARAAQRLQAAAEEQAVAAAQHRQEPLPGVAN